MSANVVITEAEAAKARHQVALLGSETEQQLSLRVQEIAPGEGPPLHIHLDQAETFHVISGIFRFQVGDKEVIGKPGFSVFIPKGTPHCFLYEGERENGQLISILTPGVHDGFIQNVPEAQAGGASPEVLSALAATFGVKIQGPGLSPES